MQARASVQQHYSTSQSCHLWSLNQLLPLGYCTWRPYCDPDHISMNCSAPRGQERAGPRLPSPPNVFLTFTGTWLMLLARTRLGDPCVLLQVTRARVRTRARRRHTTTTRHTRDRWTAICSGTARGSLGGHWLLCGNTGLFRGAPSQSNGGWVGWWMWSKVSRHSFADVDLGEGSHQVSRRV